MHTLITPYVIILVFLLYSPLISAGNTSQESSSITVLIDHTDGGETGNRHLSKLLEALKEERCHARAYRTSDQAPAQLIFDSSPTSIAEKKHPNYRLVSRAKTLNGEVFVRGAILVHASTGINDLASLRGQRIAFVSKDSPTGYAEPVKLLLDAGVKESWDTFFYVGNHVGATSMLLHGDTDVAVIAEPLAQQWADYNGLSIVAVTKEIETGGWWVHDSVSEVISQNCTRAINSLDESELKVLPAWIGGFINPPPQ